MTPCKPEIFHRGQEAKGKHCSWSGSLEALAALSSVYFHASSAHHEPMLNAGTLLKVSYWAEWFCNFVFAGCGAYWWKKEREKELAFERQHW